MVGWGFAFGRGFVVLLWSIVWAIVAGIVGVLVIGGSLSSLVSNPTAVASNPTSFLTGFLAASFLESSSSSSSRSLGSTRLLSR